MPFGMKAMTPQNYSPVVLVESPCLWSERKSSSEVRELSKKTPTDKRGMSQNQMPPSYVIIRCATDNLAWAKHKGRGEQKLFKARIPQYE